MLPQERKLSILLTGLVPAELVAAIKKYDNAILGLTLDSRQVKRQEIFCALAGSKCDGRVYIDIALQQGAAAILCEADDEVRDVTSRITIKNSDVLSLPIPIIKISNLRQLIGLIAAKFYDYPAQAMMMVGVTGTNGKTSISLFIAKLLQDLSYRCGVIGTLGAGFPDGGLEQFGNTTPDAITLQRQLYYLQQHGARAVAMEVSSHALVQQRVQGAAFKLGIFTNLTRDHLDYHGDMENYGKAKKILFSAPELQYAVINRDDEFSEKILQDLSPSIKTYVYGIDGEVINQERSIIARNIKFNQKNTSGSDSRREISADIVTPWGTGVLKSKLLGKFYVSNLLAIITTLGIMGFALDEVLAKIALLQPLPGRMQSLGCKNNQPLVVVDYAHTPDALEQALRTLREYCTGNLWVVFGCGGDRDRGKRPLMGQVVERYSDHIVITDDNPRTENSQQIVNDIMHGLLCPWGVEVEHDRRVAITHAIECAATHDIILVAGKGHEDYQIIGNEKIHLNDVEIVQSVLDINNSIYKK